jgi:small-conductance mechanosensitive channel
MVEYFDFLVGTSTFFPTAFSVLIIVVTAYLFYRIITMAIKRVLLSKAKTKKQRNNLMVFLSIWKYSFAILIIIGLIFFLGGDITGLGLWAGLLTAALGWALQKPITGVAGYLMVIIKKPFQLGDRVMIGTVKGDVIDISLTHIYLREIGGTIGSEETSGRTIMIPNSILFEQNIINYTLRDEYILEQIVIAITYESDLHHAMKICEQAARKVTRGFLKDSPKPPYTRTFFQPSGIDVKTRFYVRASERIKVASDLTQEIFKGITEAKDVEIAYPHTEVVLRKKTPRR